MGDGVKGQTAVRFQILFQVLCDDLEYLKAGKRQNQTSVFKKLLFSCYTEGKKYVVVVGKIQRCGNKE